jgi:glucose-6-phosphate isomerase
MGGSSLGPEVIRRSFGEIPGGLRLQVLDSTHPDVVLRARESIDLRATLFVVSSKSGTTIETLSHYRHFREHAGPEQFVAITDPGTPLATLATDNGFRRLFLNPPDIGGRYSVLSYFGLVPAALMGVRIEALLHRCQVAEQNCAHHDSSESNSGLWLGATLGELARRGRDKLTFVVSRPIESVGLWVEQLIAESTGKRGTGCVPVPTTEAETGDDRHVVLLEMDDDYQLGSQFMVWEAATAIAGHVLDIDPFDEPNVAESKENTKKVLSSLPLPAVESADPSTVSSWLKETVGANDYVSLQAYLPFGQDEALERLRRGVRDGLGGVAVTAGYGPRFLHSTGQLHKGGPNEVVAVQIAPRAPTAHVEIPGKPYDFGTLIDAQAIGDLQSLESHGRRVLRVEVNDLKEVT